MKTPNTYSDLRYPFQNAIQKFETYKSLPDQDLSVKPNPSAWSVAEIFEHILLFNNIYQKMIRKAIDNNNSTVTKSGHFNARFHIKPMTDHRKAHHLFMLMIFPLLFGGCLSPVQKLYPENIDERTVPLYIVSHGWHAGIAIESEYIRHLLPEHSAIPESALLKFGWGDYRYYSEPDAGFWLMLRAAMIPTRSTLHVVGIDIPIERYFFNSRIIRIQITTEGAENLGRFISERFYRDSDGDVQFQSDGLYSDSAFFRAKGLYYMPKTSNIWTARALRQTGFPITPIYGLTSGNVMKQASKDGEWIRE